MPDGNKKVFISWSKATSKRVASVLKEYLPEILDGVDLFMSDKDIGPGERSMKVIESQLDGTTYGLLVVTAENQGESWLNFEAGALSKQVGKDEDDLPRVVPLLVDIENPNQLTGPVSQFQAVKCNDEGLLRTILSIATLVGTDSTVVEKRFRRAWPEMQDAIKEAKQVPIGIQREPERSVDSKIDEVLQILRAMQRRQDINSEVITPLGTLIIASTTERKLDDIAAQYGLKRFSTTISPRTGEVEMTFKTTETYSDANMRNFERGVKSIVGSAVEVTRVDEAAGAEVTVSVREAASKSNRPQI